MSKHTHRAVKSLSKDYAWTGCVDHCKPHTEQSHGNIIRLDVCRCGAERASEHNANASIYAKWSEARR